MAKRMHVTIVHKSYRRSKEVLPSCAMINKYEKLHYFKSCLVYFDVGQNSYDRYGRARVIVCCSSISLIFFCYFFFKLRLGLVM